MVADGRSLLPRDVGLRLRRVAPRRLLPRGPQEGRHARLLLLAADLGRGQLHVPQAPLREDDRAVARASAPGLRVHAEGQPADHPLEAARGRGGGRPRVRDDGQAARATGSDACCSNARRACTTTPTCSRGSSTRFPRAARPTRWSSDIRRGRRLAMRCSSAAWPGASPRPTTRTRSPRICPGSRSATCGCGRPSTAMKSSRRGRSGSDRPWMPVAPSSRYFKHEDEGASPEDGEAARGDAAGSGGEPSGALARRHLTASAVTPHAGSLPGRGGVGAPPRGGRDTTAATRTTEPIAAKRPTGSVDPRVEHEETP